MGFKLAVSTLNFEHSNSSTAVVQPSSVKSNTSDSMLNILTMRQVHENVNRMLLKEVFVEVAALTGKPFDIGACCDDNGVNSHCASYCSPSSSFLKHDVSGQHVCMNVPTNRIEVFIKHYLKCKARAPQSTSACVVPCWQGPWRKLLTRMKLLKSYEQGSTWFTVPRRGSNCHGPHGPAPWVVEIWYDAPAPAVQVNSVASDAYELLFTFPGLIAGVPARIAVDNCATHNFCDHAFAVLQGLDVQPCSGSVVCAGTESVRIKGCVHVCVQIQSKSQVVKLLVTHLTGDKLHAILVRKKSGELRMCVNYRALNHNPVKDKYPLPCSDDLLDRLQGASVFSSLDLQSGYHQIRIVSEDLPKTAFSTPLGLFEFCVLPLG